MVNSMYLLYGSGLLLISGLVYIRQCASVIVLNLCEDDCSKMAKARFTDLIIKSDYLINHPMHQKFIPLISFS